MPWFNKRKQDTLEVQEPTAVYAIPMESPISALLKKDYRAEGLRRDAAIVAVVQRQGVITSDFVQIAISHEHFDLPGESPTAVLNRLTALADRGYFHRLERTRSGHIAYGTRRPRKGSQPQVVDSICIHPIFPILNASLACSWLRV